MAEDTAGKPSIYQRYRQLVRDGKAPTSKEEYLARGSCVLVRRAPCCKGLGVRYKAQGPYVRAELCPCMLGCLLCRGTAMSFQAGDARPCRTPNPLVIKSYFNRADIPVRYLEADFASFRNTEGSGKRIAESMEAWTKRFVSESRPQKGILLQGDIGVGKTYLLACLAKNLVQAQCSVKYISFPQLIVSFKEKLANRNSDSERGEALTSLLQSIDVLLIDDLGKGMMRDGTRSHFAQSVLEQIVLNRYNHGQLVVAATSFPMRQDDHQRPGASLEDALGSVILGRLLEICDVRVFRGRDFRSRFSAPSQN